TIGDFNTETIGLSWCGLLIIFNKVIIICTSIAAKYHDLIIVQNGIPCFLNSSTITEKFIIVRFKITLSRYWISRFLFVFLSITFNGGLSFCPIHSLIFSV